MLAPQWMGLFALGILWLNTGLILLVALRQLGNLLHLRARLAEAAAKDELVEGTVVSSNEGERFALRHIQQTGRAVTTRGPERILFTDGPQSFEVLGGTIDAGGTEIEVAQVMPAASEVWPDPARSKEAVACPSPSEFERAYEAASKYKGHTREVEIVVRTNDRVWVHGVRKGRTMEASDRAPLLVSLVDPIAWVDSRVRILLGFVAGASAVLVGLTTMALWPPHFGVISTIGAAIGLVYFLGVQPLGVAVRDAVKTPARRLVGAVWEKPVF